MASSTLRCVKLGLVNNDSFITEASPVLPWMSLVTCELRNSRSSSAAARMHFLSLPHVQVVYAYERYLGENTSLLTEFMVHVSTECL